MHGRRNKTGGTCRISTIKLLLLSGSTGEIYRAQGKFTGYLLKKAIVYMKELAAECEDTSLLKMLEFYRKHPAKFWAKRLAVMLHQTKHSRIVDLLSERLQQATADYPRKIFGDDVERKYQQALERAKQRQRELKSQGIRADLLREEPLRLRVILLNYKLYLMIWKEQKGESSNRNRRIYL